VWFGRTWQRLLRLTVLRAPAQRDAPDADLWYAGRLTTFTRVDALWAAGTGLVSAGLFATILYGHSALGDAPETIAGVSSLGILHDPGYPTYVLSAHLFTLLVPVGDEALRVALFSVVCASASIAGTQLLARRFGVPRWAGSLGALTLAASAGFWYYAAFAKHDVFSGLLFLLTLHLAIAWLARPSTKRLVALAAVIAWGLGSSWPLEALALPAVGFVLFVGRRRLPLPSLAVATGTGLAVIVAIAGFVMIRASANPPLNWGDATNLSRLVALVNRADFTAHGSHGQSAPAGPASGSGASASGSGLGQSGTGTVPGGAVTNPIGDASIFGRELGVLALILAAVGLIASVTRRRNAASFPVLIAFLGNLLGAAIVVGFGRSSGGLETDLVTEGFVLGCYFALACWIGLGCAELADGIRRIPVARLTGRGTGEGSAEGAPRSPARGPVKRVLAAVGVIALGAALVLPLAVGNWSTVRRSSKPFADRYAQTVFSELPPHAAMFVLGAELTQPMIYRQVVYHERPDVTVVALDGLPQEWYRAQISRKLGVQLPPTSAGAARVLNAVARVRPVYIDARGAQTLASAVGYEPVGLISQLVPGPPGQAPVFSPAALEGTFMAAARRAGFPNHAWDVWPNDFVMLSEYSTAALQLAQAQYQRGDLAGMRRSLQEDLRILPGNPPALTDLKLLNRGKA
jgi:Protein O-mannosyl-transferase TMEM260-like